MKEQKNIERLFQEKFKDFEAIPPKDAWANIAAKLNEKKQKKRVIPFWFQLSGIAASLIIIGSLIWNYQSDDVFSAPNNNVVTSEDALKERSRGTVDSNEVITAVDENQNSSSLKFLKLALISRSPAILFFAFSDNFLGKLSVPLVTNLAKPVSPR